MRLRFYLILILFLFGCKQGKKLKTANPSTDFPKVFIENLDSSLLENSGMIFWNNYLWTFNDSGGKNELYAVDQATGKIKYAVEITNATNVDWEDIAQDENYIYVAEFGNNFGDRKDLQVLKIAKGDLKQNGSKEVTAEKIRFSYNNQKNFDNEFRGHRFDCEALMVYENALYFFSKDWISNKTLLYTLPVEPGSYAVSPIDSFNVDGLITGADILEDGRYALVGYKDFKSFVWLFAFTENDYFSSPRQIKLDMLKNAQTEGIAFTDNGKLLISCERTLNHSEQVWEIPYE